MQSLILGPARSDTLRLRAASSPGGNTCSSGGQRKMWVGSSSIPRISSSVSSQNRVCTRKSLYHGSGQTERIPHSGRTVHQRRCAGPSERFDSGELFGVSDGPRIAHCWLSGSPLMASRPAAGQNQQAGPPPVPGGHGLPRLLFFVFIRTLSCSQPISQPMPPKTA